MTTKETAGPKNVLKKQQGFYLMNWQAGRRELLEGPHDRASVIEVAIRDLGFPITKANFDTHAAAAGVMLGTARYGDTQLSVRVRLLERNLELHQQALLLMATPGFEADGISVPELLAKVQLAGSDSGAARDVPGQMRFIDDAVPAQAPDQAVHDAATAGEGLGDKPAVGEARD